MGDGKAVEDELRTPARDLRHAIPAVYAGFARLHDAALRPGALDAKTKELIALAIAVSEGGDGCIAAHARGAALRGATLEDAAEAIGVAILMDGGPGTVYGPRAYAAFHEFHAEDQTRPAGQAGRAAATERKVPA
ncbi:MAG: carboxymuconolactone decarboxylase family protein [Streptosporangiales bacterium]|nr:carboxymuconolactone decarboxylase family protein [Streptosporangiales bacterium]